MSHPLAWLLWRDTRSAVRSSLRRLRTPRGVLAVVGLLAFGATVGLSTPRDGLLAGGAQPFVAPGLMLLVLLGVFSPHGLYFRPPDVHWLLPAPLSRSALVLYNVAVRARPAFLSGLLLSLLPSWRGAGWWQAFTGLSLIFLLLQISAQWMAVLRAWLALHASAGWRRALGIAMFGLPLVAVGIELRARPELGASAFAAESRTLAIFSAPVRPFVGAVTAPDAIAWGVQTALATALLAALVAHIVWLRVPYREAAIQHSEHRAQRFSRMRSGGGAFGAGPASSGRRLPMPPQLGGAGPVAWRQAQELVRNPRGIALLLVIVALVVGAVVAVPWLHQGTPDLGAQMGRTGMFLVVLVPLMMGDNLACDFRRDLDRLGQLKTWPIAPLALAAGQIAPAALFLVGVQSLGLTVVALATGAVDLAVALYVLLLLPSVTWTALCLDNLLFLWLPYRTVPEDPGDVAFVGRTLTMALFKLTTLAAIAGLAFGLGVLALRASGSAAVAVALPAAILLVACAACTAVVGRAFARYDVARHGPR